MNRFRFGTMLVAGLAVVAAMYVWHQMARDTAAPPRTPKQPPIADIRAERMQAEAPAAVASHAQSSSNKKLAQKDFRKLFAQSRNYWDYAHEILSAARVGNADAQFYLSKVLEFCDYANRAYFRRGNAALTLDQALQLAVKQNRPVEVTQAIFERCHEFDAQDATELGSSMDWLAKATKAGQPVARATMAQKMFSQDLLKSYLRAGAAPTPENTAASIGDGADPRALLRAAVKTLDPEALFTVGMAQGAYEQLHPSSHGRGTNQLAWMLVACQRGFDCSGNADWITTGCPNCGTRSAANQSPDNTMMIIAGDNWPAVQQRAQEISAELDAEQWEELDLGS